jgi:hypothetical protein
MPRPKTLLRFSSESFPPLEIKPQVFLVKVWSPKCIHSVQLSSAISAGPSLLMGYGAG